MSESLKVIARRWFEEVWNSGRLEAVDEMFAADGVGHGLGLSEADVHGPAEFKPFLLNMRGSIPDIHVDLQDLIAEGDRVAIRVTLTGTHSGEGLGVPPTGRSVSFQGIIILRIVDGLIVEGWNSYDQLGLLQQIRALPSLGGGDRFLSLNE